MNKRKIFSLILVFCLSSVCTLLGNDLDIGERYALLATTRTNTMQKEMSAAAELGFRIQMAGPTRGNEIVILMEKLATPGNPYRYKLLATTRTGTMEKELNEAGEAGFRIIPQTLISKKRPFGSDEIVVVLENAPDSSAHFKYRLLATRRTSTMEEEILEAEEAGYVLVGICSRDEHVSIMEKEVP